MRCSYCGEIIEPGDTYYCIGNERIDTDCIMDYLDEWCREGDKYVIEDEEVEEDDLNFWFIDHALTCTETEEIADPRYEPEYWEDR